MMAQSLEEQLAVARSRLETERCMREVAEQELGRQRERIAEVERQLNEARSRIQTLLDDNADEHTEWLHYRAQVRELERQLAAEREARLRAEAACAAFRVSLEEIRQWAYRMPVLLTGLDKPPEDGQLDEYVHGQIARLAQRALLASPDPGTEMLEAGRAMYRALNAAWSIIEDARTLDPQGLDRLCETRGWDDGAAVLAGERWFGKEEAGD